MTTSTATIESPLAKRYLTQLCKHFEHKLPVTHGDGEGRIEFPVGVCTLNAKDGALQLNADAADPDALTKLQDVVARHLVRFAFREPLAVTWEPAP